MAQQLRWPAPPSFSLIRPIRVFAPFVVPVIHTAGHQAFDVLQRQVYEDNLGAAEAAISDDDRRRLDEVSLPGRALVDYYRADFGPQQHRW